MKTMIVCGKWRTSEHSNPNGECVELAHGWVKSRYSNGTNCLEVRACRAVFIRDSKLGEDSAVLAFSPVAFRAFITKLKGG